jgi:hypothetical protein
MTLSHFIPLTPALSHPGEGELGLAQKLSFPALALA